MKSPNYLTVGKNITLLYRMPLRVIFEQYEQRPCVVTTVGGLVGIIDDGPLHFEP